MASRSDTALLLGLALLWCAGGCTRRYFVRPSHLARTQAGTDAVLPALDDEREPTFLRASAIRRLEGLDATGLQQLRARDARNFLRVTGWVSTAIGVLLGTIALPILVDQEPGDEAIAGLVFGVESIVHLAIGVPFLAAGYLSGGAEEEGPSPGMPASILEP